MAGRLEGKTALITGAARGQGRSHALAFAREGANIVACDIAEDIEALFYELASPEDLEETKRVVEHAGGSILTMKADVRSSADMESVAAAAVERFGAIDILLANAGIMDHGSWDASDEQWDLMMDINLNGVYRTCRAVVPQMIRQDHGAIVLTASLAAIRPHMNMVPYAVAKHGVVGLMKSLATDLAPHHIRVNSVCPSAVASPMFTNQATYTIFAGGDPNATIEHARFPTRMMHSLPVDWMEVEDISNAMVWLASDEARYVNGVELTIDAGAHIQPPGIPPAAWEYVHPPQPPVTYGDGAR